MFDGTSQDLPVFTQGFAAVSLTALNHACFC